MAKSKIVETAATVGDVAPDFTLTDSKGSAVTLSDELKKGPVVLTFYGSLYGGQSRMARF